ncbi:MAG: FAD-dependent oxidoreductase [Betaproteobacteria bacterium]|nr:FAD-dependent oxidoreductase [Betaproteobacteria bacterium]
MHVLVLGAGLIGTASAWFLAQSGHRVTVVDRQPGPGLETSYANGGQISVSHAEPWANPHAPLQILKWIGRDDAPLLFRLRADPALWFWGLRFLRECTTARTRHNIGQLVRLGMYSRAALQALRRETGIEYDHLERGILHFYTTAPTFAAAVRANETMAEHGCDGRVVDAEECMAIEPVLRQARVPITGGTFTPGDESGDAHKFTTRLAALCRRDGVEFVHGVRMDRLVRAGSRISRVDVVDPDGQRGELSADAFVVALGSYSPLLLRTIGVSVPVYPAKGYSITLPVEQSRDAPTVSLTDDEHKLVVSRLGNRLRVAGTAEFNGYDTSIDVARCEAIRARAAVLFPRAGDFARAEYWAGLRPATPGNVPLIGPCRFENLYLNTGHGTLGWTHSCGSGKAIADIVSGRTPEVDFAFLGTRSAAATGAYRPGSVNPGDARR